MISSRAEAEKCILPDQTFFALDAEGFAAFREMLDQPPAPTDCLRRTLKTRAPWDATRVSRPVA